VLAALVLVRHVSERLTRRLNVRSEQCVGTAPARVSVVIPSYNYARYLPTAVESVLSQEGVNVDVIVVDDASTDDSVALSRSYAARTPRVAVLANERNRGPVDTFNKGLARAEGEFVVRLDADDALTPGSLARSVDVARAYPSVGLVYGHPLHFEAEPLPEPRLKPSRWTLWPGTQWLELCCRAGANVISSPEALMRRSVVDVVGGQRLLAHTHDMEMWLRIAAFSDVAYVHGADQAWHRDHALSLSTRSVDVVVDFACRRDAFAELFTGMAGELPGAQARWRTARRSLAREALRFACHAYDRGRAEEQVVDSLVVFARGCEADVEMLPEWRQLERRRRLGNVATSRRPWFVARAAMRGVGSRMRHRRWSATGMYVRYPLRRSFP